jgi:hypothetical protein
MSRDELFLSAGLLDIAPTVLALLRLPRHSHDGLAPVRLHGHPSIFGRSRPPAEFPPRAAGALARPRAQGAPRAGLEAGF